jgi:putative membrane protein
MVNYNPKNWIHFIFSLHKSDTIRILWKELIYIAILTALITFIEIHFFGSNPRLKNLTAVYSLLGFVISLLLVFRTNTAYDRWWEGRKLWGSVVNDSRNLATILSTLELNETERKRFSQLLMLFSSSMKSHLRGEKITDLNAFQEVASADNQPLFCAKQAQSELHRLLKDERIDTVQWMHLNKLIANLVDSLGACERIKNTPIPYSYSLFFKKFIFIYVVTMPLAFVEPFGYWSVLISTFVFYALVSMEILAEEIEDPFGTDENDLPLDDICARIAQNVSDVLTPAEQPKGA